MPRPFTRRSVVAWSCVFVGAYVCIHVNVDIQEEHEELLMVLAETGEGEEGAEEEGAEEEGDGMDAAEDTGDADGE